METVGGYLKKERESNDISIPELSQLTKISELYLKYIENDEFEKLPQGPYVKGYIASYARLIGGNVDEAISLYEALNKKTILTEEINPETPSRKGWNRLPKKPQAEQPQTKTLMPPKGALSGKVVSFLSTIASSLSINADALKAAGTSIKNVGASLRPNGKRFDKVVPLVKQIAQSRSLKYALIALIVTGILVFAGFGFYHVFIYDPDPLTADQLQPEQDREARPLPASGSEKSVLPSPSANASPTADPPKDHAENTKRAEPNIPSEAQPALSPTDPAATPPRTKSQPEGSTVASDPARQTDTSLPGSSSTAAVADSSRTTADTESQARSGQNGLTADPSPQSPVVDAPLRVLRASVCTEIENRMPAGVDTSFPAAIQRVYVWNEIEARQVPSKIRHIYFLDGQKISDVTLDVRSAYWRTWSTKSLSDDRYRGEWRVDIATAGGKLLRRLYFEVK